jgi:hypothetical protein
MWTQWMKLRSFAKKFLFSFFCSCSGACTLRAAHARDRRGAARRRAGRS